jgi:hypothetical protein
MSQLVNFITNLQTDDRLMTYSTLQLKQAVILKMLHLLGWDAFDVSKVQADHLAGGITIDYALQTPTNGMIFLHTVKPLTDATHDKQHSILQIAAAEGVRIVVLTDGVHWQLFAPMMRGTFNEKQFASLNLAQQTPEECEQVLRFYLSHRIALSGTAFLRAEKVCSDRIKKKNENLSGALVDAWDECLAKFRKPFLELLVMETKRLDESGVPANTSIANEASTFYDRFITLTTSELPQARRVKYDANDFTIAQAWKGLLQQLEPLFIELITFDIEKAHGFKPEKESVSTYLHGLMRLHDMVSANIGAKRKSQTA